MGTYQSDVKFCFISDQYTIISRADLFYSSPALELNDDWYIQCHWHLTACGRMNVSTDHFYYYSSFKLQCLEITKLLFIMMLLHTCIHNCMHYLSHNWCWTNHSWT